jgi:hypothetical protein
MRAGAPNGGSSHLELTAPSGEVHNIFNDSYGQLFGEKLSNLESEMFLDPRKYKILPEKQIYDYDKSLLTKWGEPQPFMPSHTHLIEKFGEKLPDFVNEWLKSQGTISDFRK